MVSTSFPADDDGTADAVGPLQEPTMTTSNPRPRRAAGLLLTLLALAPVFAGLGVNHSGRTHAAYIGETEKHVGGNR